MNAPSLAERVQVLEDETAGLESALDARTKVLRVEIEKLKFIVKELQESGGKPWIK